jgi:hypothetical protein
VSNVSEFYCRMHNVDMKHSEISYGR